MIGVAVKMAGEPGQKGFGLAAIDMPAGGPTESVIVIKLDIPGFPETQSREEVRTQDTISPDPGK